MSLQLQLQLQRPLHHHHFHHLSISSSIKFAAVLLSLSFPLSRPLPTSVHATARDVLSLLGPVDRATKLDPNEARQLWSCFKFLVPFKESEFMVSRRSMRSIRRENGEKSVENELIWRPPEAVLELARLAVDSGGDPDVVYRTLDPTVIHVPDVEGSNKQKCQLTRYTYGWRFMSKDLNAYLKFLFKMIVSRGPTVGLNATLSRYDLFHGHVFLAKGTGRLGILFHAKEYPAYDKRNFPLNMGYCQTGSNVAYDETMNLRNILWLAPLPSNSSKAWVAPGVLVVLDARPDGIIYRDLIPDYVQIARTIYEDDFGEVAVDVNYLNVGSTSPDYQIFLC